MRFYLNKCTTKNNSNKMYLFILKQDNYYVNFQNPREASSQSRIFLFYLVNMLVCVSVRHLLAQTKKDTDMKFGTPTPRPYLNTDFLFFSKSDLEGR